MAEIQKAGFWVGCRVIARAAILDSPLADTDSSCRRGDVGSIEDIDSADGWLLVDFGRGAIIVHPSEVR